MSRRAMVFVDGENTVYRYQAMLAEERHAALHVLHSRDAYVWHHDIAQFRAWDLVRVSYYTSRVGDEDSVHELEIELAKIKYKFLRPSRLRDYGFLVPRVFKKQKKNQKTAAVDINIAIDVLRHVYTNAIDEFLLISGDGDYLPLIQDAMRYGKTVYVGAFSSGLSPLLRTTPDEFIDLDKMFFKD